MQIFSKACARCFQVQRQRYIHPNITDLTIENAGRVKATGYATDVMAINPTREPACISDGGPQADFRFGTRRHDLALLWQNVGLAVLYKIPESSFQ